MQDFIRESVREKVFDEPEITREELILVQKLIKASKENLNFGSEEELFHKLE